MQLILQLFPSYLFFIILGSQFNFVSWIFTYIPNHLQKEYFFDPFPYSTVYFHSPTREFRKDPKTALILKAGMEYYLSARLVSFITEFLGSLMKTNSLCLEQKVS